MAATGGQCSPGDRSNEAVDGKWSRGVFLVLKDLVNSGKQIFAKVTIKTLSDANVAGSHFVSIDSAEHSK